MKNVLFPILIFPFVLQACFNPYLNFKVKTRFINGIIIGTHEDETGCFGVIVYKEGNRVDSLNKVCYCGFETPKLYNYILPNDSLYKRRGSTILTVIRQGKKREFPFPECIQ